MSIGKKTQGKNKYKADAKMQLLTGNLEWLQKKLSEVKLSETIPCQEVDGRSGVE